MFQLRPYQAEAKQAILAAWDEGYRKTLLVLPTGCGKTVVFSSVTENQVNKGHRVLIMAHRGELLDQAADKLKEASGLDSVLEKADSTSLGSFLPVTVGSVQSLAQEKRLARFPDNYFQDIIVDEAHHCLSDSYQSVLDHFPEANILGVTATPDRGDMKNLGEFFDSKAYEYSMTEAIREGYLCPIKAQMIPLELDINEASEFRAATLPQVRSAVHWNRTFDQIAQEMKTYCKGRKTVVFLPLIATARSSAGC
jgi:superfamily II DNA or RNA helicase